MPVRFAWSLSLCCALLLAGCGDDPTQVPSDGSSSSTSSASTGTPPPGTTTGTTSVGPTTAVADETGTSSTTGPDPGPGCCEAHSDPGCDDPDIAACVCRQEAFCCAFDWDADCVTLAEQCGGCGGTTTGDTTGTTGEPPVHPCCDPAPDPGCPEDPAVEACVCALDAFCCDTQWDDVCGMTAVRQCGVTCGGGAAGACCAPSGSPGCAEDPAIEACVCALDAFCCDTQWDGQCVDTAAADCGAMCMVMGGGDCCAPNGSPGCDDVPTQDCVCALDPFCCSNEWDDICVSEAHYACMIDCGLPPANQGDCCMQQPGPGCGDMMVTECACLVDDGCCLFPWNDACIQTAVNGCGIMCPGFDPQPPCCQIQMGPGCGDMAIENCVCALDPFCCSNQWDDICVGEAQSDCMVDCGGMGGPPGGDCCMANGSPGCDVPDVQDCVCMLDPFCCSVEWDDICVGEANTDCGGCMGPGTGSGTGMGSGSGGASGT